MYISKIKIDNFKAISKMSIDLKPGINLLIGDNGVGKTSILDAIVVALGGFLNGVNGVSSKNILLSDIKMHTINLGRAAASIQYDTPVRIECELWADGEMYSWLRIREAEGSRRNTKIVKERNDISKYARTITNDVEKNLPIFSYQSSVRASQTRRGDFGANIKKKMDDRRCGYLGCLDSVLDIKRIKEWCYEMQRVAFDQDCTIEEYEQFKKIVGMFMQKMSETENVPKIYYSRLYNDLVYEEGKSIQPVSCLSAGYQSLLWMIMDIAYRMATLNPRNFDYSKCEGIILIDEIDMHLHPKWQWNVIPALEQIFPNIQFIIATHSPIIISSCKKSNLVLIDDDQNIKYLEDAYGYSVNDVLELRQGSRDVLVGIKKFRDAFDKAIDREDYSGAQDIFDKMKTEYGDDNSEVKVMKEELETELFLKEDK